ncbi:SNW domain-containing protein 1-like [Rhopilema esculentum]|uniref:SNW domain-containing protein 1-like n=1 Tax=Rhopilema esculentum TaxID=499914 RepID=UPI0031D50B88
MALARLLPAPTQITKQEADDDDLEHAFNAVKDLAIKSSHPPYGQRRGWIPRRPEDFGDGGAFPEIHVAQYPLGMGKERKKASTAIPIRVDQEGKIKYDDLLRSGQKQDKVIHSKFQDLVPAQIKKDDPELARPDDEAIKETTEKTRLALEKEVNSKIAAAQPAQAAKKLEPAKYIRYTPSQQGITYNSGAKQRVIRMVEMQSDPMEPPRFKTNKKIPRGPPSPPAPVMHSPTRKVTVKEQQEWKIPPCISNWKNPKGYTIPLDKRLASDGRGLQDPHINDKFAKLAEALYIADRKAREAVEIRAQLEQKMAQKEKEKKEEYLKKMAQQAREERAGIKTASKDREEAERDQLRYDRHKDRERDRRISKAAPDKRSKLMRDKDRDVSEKIALGMPSNAGNQESMYDQRLFNRSQGMDSGFGEEDSYNVYDQAWRKTDSASSVYRPSKNLDKDTYGDDIETLIKTNRFVPDKDFAGTDRTHKRDGPVQFEKFGEEDLSELDKFFLDAKRGGKRSEPMERESSKSSKRSKR